MTHAVEISNLNEGFEPIVTAPQINQCNDEQQKFFDALITASDALGMFVFMEGIEESADGWIVVERQQQGESWQQEQVRSPRALHSFQQRGLVRVFTNTHGRFSHTLVVRYEDDNLLSVPYPQFLRTNACSSSWG